MARAALTHAAHDDDTTLGSVFMFVVCTLMTLQLSAWVFPEFWHYLILPMVALLVAKIGFMFWVGGRLKACDEEEMSGHEAWPGGTPDALLRFDRPEDAAVALMASFDAMAAAHQRGEHQVVRDLRKDYRRLVGDLASLPTSSFTQIPVSILAWSELLAEHLDTLPRVLLVSRRYRADLERFVELLERTGSPSCRALVLGFRRDLSLRRAA